MDKVLNELSNLINWIEKNKVELLPYIPKDFIQHKGLWGYYIMINVVAAIREGDTNAILIACKFIIDDPKVFFGRSIKSRMARALKLQIINIPKTYQISIIRITRKLIELNYAPRETHDYCRLVSKFRKTHCSEIELIKVHDEISNKFKKYLLQSIGCI